MGNIKYINIVMITVVHEAEKDVRLLRAKIANIDDTSLEKKLSKMKKLDPTVLIAIFTFFVN